MTIVEINSSTVGSTGRIMFMIAEEAEKAGYSVYTCSAVHGNERKINSKKHIYIGNKLSKKIHLLLAKYTGYNGCFSILDTWIFLKKIDKIKPDLIHLHNLHNCYINVPMLFRYIKEKDIKVIWTMHDCWPFTGKCPYFDAVKCERWKDGCGQCPQLERYPISKVDNTAKMYQMKEKCFTGANITIITPSKWLADLVHQSFLRSYPVYVINNGIDLDIFRPRDTCSLKSELHIKNKFVILGVANPWEYRKGFDVFIELRKRLEKKYSIILVGLSDDQKHNLPDGIIGISRTNNQQELSRLYSVADVFINPTREDNFPTANIEALACGTGVITFNAGGSPEMLNEQCGIVVEKEDIDALIYAIKKIEQSPFDKKKCQNIAQMYDSKAVYSKYVRVYNTLLEM